MIKPGSRVRATPQGEGTVLAVSNGKAEVCFDTRMGKDEHGEPIRRPSMMVMVSDDMALVPATWHALSSLEEIA